MWNAAHASGRDTATVAEVLAHPDEDIRGYAEFLFQNDYAPYTAKKLTAGPRSGSAVSLSETMD